MLTLVHASLCQARCRSNLWTLLPFLLRAKGTATGTSGSDFDGNCTVSHRRSWRQRTAQFLETVGIPRVYIIPAAQEHMHTCQPVTGWEICVTLDARRARTQPAPRRRTAPRSGPPAPAARIRTRHALLVGPTRQRRQPPSRQHSTVCDGRGARLAHRRMLPCWRNLSLPRRLVWALSNRVPSSRSSTNDGPSCTGPLLGDGETGVLPASPSAWMQPTPPSTGTLPPTRSGCCPGTRTAPPTARTNVGAAGWPSMVMPAVATLAGTLVRCLDAPIR